MHMYLTVCMCVCVCVCVFFHDSPQMIMTISLIWTSQKKTKAAIPLTPPPPPKKKNPKQTKTMRIWHENRKKLESYFNSVSKHHRTFTVNTETRSEWTHTRIRWRKPITILLLTLPCRQGEIITNFLLLTLVCRWFVGCLTSQQHASVCQGRICLDNSTCCHQTFHLTQSQYTDTGPTSPSTYPITPGGWQGSYWSAKF